MPVWLTTGREIGASLLLTCLNIVIGGMLISLGVFLALAVSIQARRSRLEASAPARSRAVRAKEPS